MSDVLAAGSKRLAKAVDIDVSDEGCDWGPIHEVDPQSIYNDPGVKALVEYVERRISTGGALGREDARAALKLWEDGEECTRASSVQDRGTLRDSGGAG